MSFTKTAQLMMLALALGCAKKSAPETPAPEPAPAPAPAPEAAPAPREAARAPIIAPVNFETGSTEVAATEEAAIDEAAQIMKNSEWKVIVLGLADASGDAATNKQLSEARAAAVAAKLREKVTVPDSRVIVHAIGERLATGATQSERKVEFVFFEDEGLPLREVVIRSRVLEEDFRAKRDGAGN